MDLRDKDIVIILHYQFKYKELMKNWRDIDDPFREFPAICNCEMCMSIKNKSETIARVRTEQICVTFYDNEKALDECNCHTCCNIMDNIAYFENLIQEYICPYWQDYNHECNLFAPFAEIFQSRSIFNENISLDALRKLIRVSGLSIENYDNFVENNSIDDHINPTEIKIEDDGVIMTIVTEQKKSQTRYFAYHRTAELSPSLYKISIYISNKIFTVREIYTFQKEDIFRESPL